MSRPDPIQYAERLYSAIRAANFSPMSFLAFGNAVKDGVAMRSMPRIAAEPFMRIVGEMLDLEGETAEKEFVNADAKADRSLVAPDVRQDASPLSPGGWRSGAEDGTDTTVAGDSAPIADVPSDRRRDGEKR